MRRSLVALTLLVAAGCGSETRVSPEQPASPPASPSAPCTSDADCRAESASGCNCVAVLASSPVGSCPHPCAMEPCTGQEAYCQASSSTCRTRPSP